MSDSLKNIYDLAVNKYLSLADANFSKDFKRPPESIVAAIWFEQKLDFENLKTNDKKKVEVISPGRWDGGPGPDFKDAEIRLEGGRLRRGDVEIEVFASEWDQHGHEQNPDFANTILRVCLWNDIKQERYSKIPLLELFPYLADESFLEKRDLGKDYPLTSQTMQGKCFNLRS